MSTRKQALLQSVRLAGLRAGLSRNDRRRMLSDAGRWFDEQLRHGEAPEAIGAVVESDGPGHARLFVGPADLLPKAAPSCMVH